MIEKDKIKELLHALELDYEAEPSLMYVFYVLPDGRVDNFAVSLRRGGEMSDEEVVSLMLSQYPAARKGRVVGIERQEGRLVRWADTVEVCEMLHISKRTLRRWTQAGHFEASRMGGRVYYDRAQIDRALKGGAVQENSRFDRTALEGKPKSDGL